MSVSLFRLLDDQAEPEVVSAHIDTAVSRTSPAVVRSTSGAGFVRHPRYAPFLTRCGMTTAEAFYHLPGDVVSGHPDRHVVHAVLSTGVTERSIYLKREHIDSLQAKWKNWRAGFGCINRAEREAIILKRLEKLGIAAPQWLAHGVDVQSRGFLAVDAFPRAQPLSKVIDELAEDTLRRLARNLGKYIASIHHAGITTPDLCWKHLFVDTDTSAFSMIDWASAELRVPTVNEMITYWAKLNASLPSSIQSRWKVLAYRAYRGELRRLKVYTTGITLNAIITVAEQLPRRNRLSEQQHLGPQPVWRWLDGEAFCIASDAHELFADRAKQDALYATPVGTHGITLANGRQATLTRGSSLCVLGRLSATLREKPWRSPAALASRVLTHFARHGIAAPRVLAFGQRLHYLGRAEYFLLTTTDGESDTAQDYWQRGTTKQRSKLLHQLGTMIAAIHAVGVTATSATVPRLGVQVDGTVIVNSTEGWQLGRRISTGTGIHQLAFVMRLELPNMNQRERLIVLRAYLGKSVSRARFRKSWAIFNASLRTS